MTSVGEFLTREIKGQPFYVAGAGKALPLERVSNLVVAAEIDAGQTARQKGQLKPTTDEWMRKNTGIVERGRANRNLGETTIGLGQIAGRIAIERSGVDPQTIRMLILATTTADMRVPASAHEIQEALGLENAFSFDLGASCSGFVYAVDVASSLMAHHGIKRAMVVGGDTLSTITNRRNRNTAPLFSDGAGAIVMEATDDERGIIGSNLKAAGDWQMLYCRHGGKIQMPNGRKVFNAGVEYMVVTAEAAMEEAELEPDDVSRLYLHNANVNMMNQVARQLDIPRSKMPVSIDHVGNCSSGTIPITMEEDMTEHPWEEGEIILMSSAAAGPTGAAIAMVA